AVAVGVTVLAIALAVGSRMSQQGTEGLCRGFRPVPVAAGDARAAEPDLANLLLAARLSRGGIDDQELVIDRRLAAANEPLDVLAVGLLRGLRSMGAKAVAPDRLNGEPARAFVAGGEQGRLGQAIAGIERLLAETRWGEGLREPRQRLRPNRL